ncbi:NAD(P)-binding protein [Mytilinidion resinicola]|uniref:NAD(P)-binding protein n=1 Tax=Mytilinidion resinicola TaxID=574789 RepID=A0A6A6Z333_9PEZI|nr:NAD(P)-binding protein [Mytilinidion resinicola]KAF2815516.1 NAD(P)-binding protein [Mytilinidion resinicola]
MAAPKSVFLLGAGYIGQHIIDLLLAAKHPVTALIRKAEQAAAFEKAGIKTVLGTLDDTELITEQAAQHDVAINTASCDHLPSVKAVLAGIRQRVLARQPSIYIHTSGTLLLTDEAKGAYKSDKVYRDDVPADIDALPPTAPHRHVDLAIVLAARDFGDKAQIAIIIPPAVHGFNPAHNRLSVALPQLVRFALKHGFSGYVGEGRNVWNATHVADLGRAYTTLLSYIETTASSALLENPYFFTGGQEFSWREAAEHVSRVLYKLGRIPSPEPKAFVESDFGDVYGPRTPIVLGGNARNRAIRLSQLGWEHKEKDIWSSLEEDEIPFILATQK